MIIATGDVGLVGVDLEVLIPKHLMALARKEEQRSIPAIAKDPEATSSIDSLLGKLPTTHRLLLGDARRRIREIPDESVHLAVTSPPYWTLKRYKDHPDQLGHIEDYEEFLGELDIVWKEVFRTLVPGGRLAIVVGDVCLSRRKYGRHVVIPLHASIQERCRSLGYDNLAPIIWYKISNANREVENGSSFLGKPYEPNSIVKNDAEFILFQRKPGGYRKPSLAARVLSVVPLELYRQCFQQIWTLGGYSTRKHPSPYPRLVAERLIRMFSFVGDTILDPFMGTGTSNVAAGMLGRNSIGIEVEPSYFEMAKIATEGNKIHQNRLAM